MGEIVRTASMTGDIQRKKGMLSSSFSWLLVLKMMIGLIIFLFFGLPIYRLVAMSFEIEGGVSLSLYTEILRSGETWGILKNTLITVLGSTFISVMLGFGFAWLVAYTDFRGKWLLQPVIMLPFIIPSYIVTLSWTQLFSSSGMLANWFPFIDLYSLGGIIFILGISHFPLVYLLTLNVLMRIPRDLEWAVLASGGSRRTTFFKVTWPLALPGIIGGGALAFLSNMDNFGVPAFLGIPSNITVLSTAIYQEVIGFGPDSFGRAAVFSVILGVVALAGTVIQWFLLRRSKVLETAQIDSSPRRRLGKARLAVEVMVWAFLLAITLVPLLSMFKTSVIRAYGLPFKWENLTLDHYHFVLFKYEKVQQAIVNSLTLGAGTMIVCIVIGTWIAYYRMRKSNLYSKAIEVAVGIPYALPGMVLALAMIFTWMEPIEGWNPGIYGTIWILFIAYVTRFLMLQVKSSMSAIAVVSTDMEEAAEVAGANAFHKWKRILLPLFMPGILSGALLVLITAFTELTVSSILWSSGSETVGLMIFNFEQGGYTMQSTAFAFCILVLMALIAIVVWTMQMYMKRKVKMG